MIPKKILKLRILKDVMGQSQISVTVSVLTSMKMSRIAEDAEMLVTLVKSAITVDV